MPNMEVGAPELKHVVIFQRWEGEYEDRAVHENRLEFTSRDPKAFVRFAKEQKINFIKFWIVDQWHLTLTDESGKKIVLKSDNQNSTPVHAWGLESTHPRYRDGVVLIENLMAA